MSSRVRIGTAGQGLYDITHKVRSVVEDQQVNEAVVTVFLRHTSASLLIQENADPSARRDLEAWLCRLVPEQDELYTHTEEGPDDMPAHVKAAITATHLSIPMLDGKLALGTWQGIFLWEHRHAPHEREILVSLSAAL